MFSEKPRNKARLTFTFYWPWARNGAASKPQATDSGNGDNKRDVIKDKQALGSKRANAWVEEKADTKIKAPKGDGKKWNRATKHSTSTDAKGFKSLFRRFTKRTPVQYLQQETGKEVWYKRRRISMTEHMKRMREAIGRSKQVKQFQGVDDPRDNDDDDDDSLSQTSSFRTCPWWIEKWWNLYESGDPVIEKSAEELADMSTLTERLRSLRLQHGLAEEWMQKEIDSSDIISLDEMEEKPSEPENPWTVISSFFHDPSLTLSKNPCINDEEDSISSLSKLSNSQEKNRNSHWVDVSDEPDVILPGMSDQ